MNIVILSAGRGSRLGSMTNHVPKILNVYRQKTLLEWHLECIDSVGYLSKVHVVVGYQAALVEKYLKSYSVPSIFNENWEKFNIGGSLLTADSILSLGPTLIIYGDIYYEAELLKNLISLGSPTVASVKNWYSIWAERLDNPLDDLESFKVSEDGYLTEIGKSPNSLEELQGQFAGSFSLDGSTWQSLKDTEGMENLDCTNLINISVQKGIKFKVFPYSGFWREFDLPSDFNS